MTNPTRIEVNCTTGEETVIELTEAEIAEIKAAQAIFAAQEKERDAQEAADALAKAALLERLGITDEEAKLLLK